MARSLTEIYKTINKDNFPARMTISFENSESDRRTLVFEKVEWTVDGERSGLRYGENPDQKAAFYRLINGNLVLGDVRLIEPGRWLASDLELLQSGKHPGKINITDVDAGLNILRYFGDRTGVVIVKHNNPCGTAVGNDLAETYERAYLADRIAAFGGAVIANKPIDRSTAELIAEAYCEVVAAPEYEESAVDILKSRKNLRIMKIHGMSRLAEYAGVSVLDFKSLIDGGIIVQDSFRPAAKTPEDFLPARTEYKGKVYEVETEPTAEQLDDMYFGWMVEAGVTSNSVLYVKDGVTVGIGTGEQDRVGVAQIARDKAYRNYADRLAWQETKTPFSLLTDQDQKNAILERTEKAHGGLEGSVMISDAFFPFRDGAEVGLREGVSAILQPGGSLRDFETIVACNEYRAAMRFTGQRSFRH